MVESTLLDSEVCVERRVTRSSKLQFLSPSHRGAFALFAVMPYSVVDVSSLLGCPCAGIPRHFTELLCLMKPLHQTHHKPTALSQRGEFGCETTTTHNRVYGVIMQSVG